MSAAGQLGVAVVGLGEIGQVHVDGLMRSPAARLVAVTDLDEHVCNETAARTGARSVDGLEAVLGDPEVQAVSLCLPHHLHHPLALQVIAAGRHVLVEKPLAIDAAECRAIRDAAQAAGVSAGVSHNQLFHPPHVKARALIDEGAIGDPVMLRLRLGIGGKYPGWRTDVGSAGGGLLFDAGVHRFYLARYLFGEAEVTGAVLDRPGAEGEDVAVVTLRFESGAIGVIEANYHGPAGAFDDSVEIVGTSQSLYLSGVEAEFEGFRTGPALRRYDGAWHDVPVAPGSWPDSVHASVHAFAEAVRDGRPAPVDAEDGLRVVELIHAAYAAAAASPAAV